MAHQVPWNKYIVERFEELAMLTDEERMVLRTRVAGWSITKQALELNLSPATVSRIIKRLKTKYDNVQKYDPLLPPRKAHCATLQALDKVGDRIIDYLAADKAQALRDENFTLKLAASQQAQSNYLVNQLRPCPVPAYITCNPWAASYGFNSGYNGTWG